MSNKLCKFAIGSIILSCIFFTSCQYNSSFSTIFEKWTEVEKNILEAENGLYIEKENEDAFRDFCNAYEDLSNSNIITNLISIYQPENPEDENPVRKYMSEIGMGISKKNIPQIRYAVLQLEQLDKDSTIQSNFNYILLNTVLTLLCLLITLILYVYLKKFERQQYEAKQFGIYSRFIIRGIERERERISKEIHDTVLQDLKTINMASELLSLEESELKKTEYQKTIFEESQKSIIKLRKICNNLTPSEFKHQNPDIKTFELALKNICSQFQSNTNIPCILKIQENLDISSLKMRNYIDIFRIIQESLNNIQSHAQAQNVSIVLTANNTDESKKSLKLFITDDGIGFDVKKTEKKALSQKHYGLSNIRERARNLSGSLTIISDEGSGTDIMLEVPLK